MNLYHYRVLNIENFKSVYYILMINFRGNIKMKGKTGLTLCAVVLAVAPFLVPSSVANAQSSTGITPYSQSRTERDLSRTTGILFRKLGELPLCGDLGDCRVDLEVTKATLASTHRISRELGLGEPLWYQEVDDYLKECEQAIENGEKIEEYNGKQSGAYEYPVPPSIRRW